MLTDASLKIEIVTDNNKFHENIFRNILNPLMPKIQSIQTRFQNLTVNDLESDYKS